MARERIPAPIAGVLDFEPRFFLRAVQRLDVNGGAVGEARSRRSFSTEGEGNEDDVSEVAGEEGCHGLIDSTVIKDVFHI